MRVITYISDDAKFVIGAPFFIASIKKCFKIYSEMQDEARFGRTGHRPWGIGYLICISFYLLTEP